MILIENVLGNIKKDPVWQAKLKDSTIDLLVLDQREAQKAAVVSLVLKEQTSAYLSSAT